LFAGYDSDLQVAAAVPELDLIVGGHSHTFLANSGSVPIVDTSTNAADAPVGPYPTYVNAVTAQNMQK
jgi:5'-nucleotidase